MHRFLRTFPAQTAILLGLIAVPHQIHAKLPTLQYSEQNLQHSDSPEDAVIGGSIGEPQAPKSAGPTTLRVPVNPRINVKTDFGAKGDGTTDDTAAVARAIAAVAYAGGGVLYFPKGDYFCQINASLLGSAWIGIEGDGWGSVIQWNHGVLLDTTSSTYAVVKNIALKAFPGCEIIWLASRYAALPLNGGGLQVDHVKISGSPSVCGLYHVGAEESHYNDCNFHISGPAPSVVLSGYNDLKFRSPNGTIEGVSQLTTHFTDCRFVKDQSTDTGHVLQIGGGVYVLGIERCYFNGAVGDGCITFDSGGTSGAQGQNITIRGCAFESNNVKFGEGAHGIWLDPHSGGSYNLVNLVIEDCFFRQIRNSPLTGGWYDIFNLNLDHARIRNNKSAFGGGFNLNFVTQSLIEQLCASTTLVMSAPAGSISMKVRNGHAIHHGDSVVIGLASRTDGASTTVSEIRAVKDVRSNVITWSEPLRYSHPNGDTVFYALPQVKTSQSNTWIVPGAPFVMGLDIGSQIMTGGTDLNSRTYVGPGGRAFTKQAPVIVHRPHSEEPGNPEDGMFISAYAGASGRWKSVIDLADWTQATIPAYSSEGVWYGLQLCIRHTVPANLPQNLSNGAQHSMIIPVAGAAPGDFVMVSYDSDVKKLGFSAYVSSVNAVTVVVSNMTGLPITVPPGRLHIMVLKH